MPVYDINEVLHRIRVRLHRSNLPRAKGAYYASPVNEASLSVEDVAAALTNRGGFTGNYYDLVQHVRMFFQEMAYHWGPVTVRLPETYRLDNVSR